MTDIRGKVFRSTREILRQHLPREKYLKLTEIFHKLAARVIERSSRRPLNPVVLCFEPLVYISQPPRSGGTLLRNLFDGHSGCRVFPHELSWEKNGYRWEGLEGTDGPSVYEWLWDRWLDAAIIHGLDKSHPFQFNRSLQKDIFFEATKTTIRSDREWLGVYMTSFFNAWIDYQDLYGKKQYTVAFCPWNLQKLAPIDRFFKIYPRGFRIQVVRDPLGWWASEKKYGQISKDVEDFLEDRWIQSVELGLRASDRYGDRYVLVHFDDIIKDTTGSMEALSCHLGIRSDPMLLQPSINRIPCSSNTSFEAKGTGVDPSVLDRWRGYLSAREVDFVRQKTAPLYRRAKRACINHGNS